MPEISVIIPVRNGAASLERCLQSICNQSIADQLEIIILDSMSTDNSRELAAKFNAKIINVPDGTFNHGLTRNIGVENSSGNFLYFTVQDASIADDCMLENMLKHFDDLSVVAVVGHQAVPHEKDKDPFLWYKPYDKPEIAIRKVEDVALFLNLSTIEKKSLIAWDNVVSMYRKRILIEQPFMKTEFAEDWVWSYQALLKGWKLLRDSSLVVYHYHHSSFTYNFNVAFTTNYHFYKFFKFKPSIPALAFPIIQTTYHLLKNNSLSFGQKFYWIINNYAGRFGTWGSTIIFLTRLNWGGEKSIEKGYEKYCKEIPQGKQNEIAL
jgi:rhamnosyltransferase